MASIFDYVQEEKTVKPVSSPSIFNYVEEEKPTEKTATASILDYVEETPTQALEKPTTKKEDSVFSFLAPKAKEGMPSADTSELDTLAQEVASGVSTEEVDKPTPIKFEELYKDKELFSSITDYMQRRMGSSGFQREGESDKDYVKRFTSHMRDVSNTDIALASQLTYLANAAPEDRDSAAAAFDIFDRMHGILEEGGENRLDVILQTIRGTLNPAESPTTYIAPGITTLGRKALARGVTKTALGTSVKATTVGSAIAAEGTVGATRNIAQQRMYNELISDPEERKESSIDTSEVLLATGWSMVFGTAEALPVLSPKVLNRDIDKVTKRLKQKELVGPPTPTELKLRKEIADVTDDVLSYFNPTEGRKILDTLDPEEALTHAQIKKDIGKKAVDVAAEIMLNDIKKYGPKRVKVTNKDGSISIKQETVGDAVYRVLKDLEDGEISEVAIEAGLKKAGISPSEFAEAARTTLADAASVMQAYSTLAKRIDKVVTNMVRVDPNAEDILNKYNKKVGNLGITNRFIDGIKRLERELLAIVVSPLITTVRNVKGTAQFAGIEAGINTFERVLWSFGNAYNSLKTRQINKAVDDISVGFKDAFADGFRTIYNMYNSGETRILVDKIVQYNPTLNDTLFHSATDVASSAQKQKISKFGRLLNTFNIAQDAFFRRAIFLASVKNRMKDVGLDADYAIANNLAIPSSVISAAAEDALKATFSYTPRIKKQIGGFEDLAETGAGVIIKGLEKLPFSTAAIPFPRFLANSMRVMYRYSPLGGASGLQDIFRGYKAMQAGKDGGEKLYREGMTNLLKGMTGTAALLYAIDYRRENRDVKFYERKTEAGDIEDLRGSWPWNLVLGIADLYVKLEDEIPNNTEIKELVDQSLGIRFGGGSTNVIVTAIAKAIEGSDDRSPEKLKEIIADVTAEFFGRAANMLPVRTFGEMLALVKEEESLARDPNVEPLGVEDSTDAAAIRAINKIINKIPIAKEILPEAITYFRDETPSRPGDFFTSLTGVRTSPARNRIEEEFVSLDIEPYKYYRASGFRIYDRLVIYYTLPVIEEYMYEFVRSDDYKKMSKLERRNYIAGTDEPGTGILRKAIARGKEDADNFLINLAEEQNEQGEAIKKMLEKKAFYALGENERALINEAYKKDTGKTLEESKDYGAFYDYLGATRPRLR